jgi:hypothetical protein
MTNKLTAADITIPSPILGKAALNQRSAFAVQHLMAAARFSRQCGAVQAKNIGESVGPFLDEQIACVSATIMLAVASMESNINEYLEDAHLLLPEFSAGAREEICDLLSTAPVLKKYERVLALKELPNFDKGMLPYQDADLLIALRNELVHFHPEWHDKQVRHEKLGSRLRGKFAFTPFMSESTAVIFPQLFISHGCTKWAVKTALDFMEYFAVKLGLSNRFKDHKKHLIP